MSRQLLRYAAYLGHAKSIPLVGNITNPQYRKLFNRDLVYVNKRLRFALTVKGDRLLSSIRGSNPGLTNKRLNTLLEISLGLGSLYRHHTPEESWLEKRGWVKYRDVRSTPFRRYGMTQKGQKVIKQILFTLRYFLK